MDANAQVCASGKASEIIKVGEVSAALQVGGHFWNVQRFEREGLLLDSAASSDLSWWGNLWLGCKYEDGRYGVAAKNFLADLEDYYPGPLKQGGLVYDAVDCQDYDKIWTVTRDAVELHKLDYADGRIDNQTSEIFAWPGRDNPYSLTFNGFELPAGADLAPFIDLNANRLYEPNLGEYPDILGSTNYWWVANDGLGPHNQSQGDPLWAEIHMMAYDSDEADQQGILFYDVEVINRNSVSLPGFYAGFWYYPTIGCTADDLHGYDREGSFAYSYQRPPTGDEVCFAGQGLPTHLLAVALLDDSRDRGVTSFMYYDRVNTVIGDPASSQQFYNLLEGRHARGMPLTSGGSGYNPGSTDTVYYAFPDPPSDPAGWSMCTAALPDDDRRLVMSSGGYDLEPGEKTAFTYAVIVEPNADYCPDITSIRDRVADIRNSNVTSSQEVVGDDDVIVYPNPASDHLVLQSAIYGRGVSYELVSATGSIVKDGVIDHGHTQVSTDDLPQGLYIIRIANKGRPYASKPVVVLR